MGATAFTFTAQNPSGASTYSWLQDGATIASATQPTYTHVFPWVASYFGITGSPVDQTTEIRVVGTSNSGVSASASVIMYLGTVSGVWDVFLTQVLMGLQAMSTHPTMS